MKPLLVENARIVDPSCDRDEIGALLVENGRIVDIGSSLLNQSIPDGVERIDATGLALLPGLVDARVFVGEPGSEHRETIASAAQAAAAGGVTSFIMMPDTHPVIDDIALIDFIKHTACQSAAVNIYPTAAITRGLEGQEMTEFGLLRDAGAIAFTEGRKTITNNTLLRRAMTYARDFNVPILHETQDAALTGHGVMNEGLLASWLGLSGIPKEAEVIPLERDLRLADLTQTRYHASQLSCALSADVIRHAKKRNDKITAGVSINHLCLNENDIGEYRTFFRLSPPLRSEEDRQALVEAVRDGTIDIIVSSHDPQDVDTKRLPFEDAKAGAVGLETLLPAALRLVHDGQLELQHLVRLLSTNPAKLFGLYAGTLQKGAPADFILVDLEEPWILSPEVLHSRSKNTCFENARFQGRVKATWVKGKCVFSSQNDMVNNG